MVFNLIQNSFGLDISEKFWRAVQIKKSGNKFKVVSFAELDIPEGIIKDGKFVKEKEAIELFKKLLDSAEKKISSRYTSVCLPEPKTFIKVINITYPKSKNIMAEVIEESKKHIPYPLEKIYLDWQFVNEKDKSKIIVGVCPKDIIDNFQSFLKKVNLMPVVLEIESMSIARSLFPLTKPVESPVMVVDFGVSRTGIFVYEKDFIPFSLSLGISSEDLTSHLMAKLKLKYDQAEEAKIKLGLDHARALGGLRKVLSEPLKKLAEEIRQAKYFYYEHFSNNQKITKVYLTGGGANLKGLPEFLADYLNLDVELANPLTNLIDRGVIPENKLQSCATAIGLALRQYIDL